MLLSIKNLSDYRIEAKDGGIGNIHSFLFEEQSWTVRYLVIDTGTWLPGRKVLIAPESIGKPEGQTEILPVKLTKEQIKGSPNIDTNKPVSRQQEIELHKYYNWAPYWGSGLGPVTVPYPPVVPEVSKKDENQQVPEVPTNESANPVLRSTKEIIGYNIHCEDGEIGHVDDFIVNTEDWTMRYMAVDTRNWLPGKKVLIPPDWIKDISWAESEVFVDVKRDTVKNSPEYDWAAPINREYEIRLYDYYGRPKYWI